MPSSKDAENRQRPESEHTLPEASGVELTEADVDNLLRIAKPVVLYLNRSLEIRKFTPELAKRWDITDASSFIGKPLQDVATPWSEDTKSKILEHASLSLSNLETIDVEAGDKRGIHQHFHISPYMADDGTPQGVVILDTDISELKIKDSALADSRAKLLKAQQIAKLGSWTWDLKSDNIIWSEELFRMFGLKPAVLAPSFSEQEKFFVGESWDQLNTAVKYALEKGRPFEIDLNLSTAKGEEVWMRASGAPEKDSGGQIRKLHGVALDITDQKATEKQMREAIEQAESANKYKDQFIANMSHEIRTPLNGIAGFSSLLRDEELSSEQRNHYLDIIHDCTESLLAFIADLMDLSKIEAGEMPINVVECRPYEILLLCQETFTMLAEKRGEQKTRYVINVSEKDEKIITLCDPRRLQQILTNLLDNASKYGGGDDIEFGYRLLENELEFFVCDRGIGMSKEGAEMIFERFKRVQDVSGLYEGSGLGLSLSKAIVELLGGSISVSSELGMGSKFLFKIPCQPLRNLGDTPEKISHANNSQKLRECLIGTKILVCECDEKNMLFYQVLLRKAGIKVLFANNGSDAVATVMENPDIEFVLMDMRLPKVDGIQVAKLIRDANDHVKVFGLSASYINDEERNGMRNLYSGFITQPIDWDMLIDKIAQMKALPRG